jgi:predicted ATPase/class 3 adenylate cyclase
MTSPDISAENLEERRLAAIMFTDIVGYTALTQANEARALEILEKHNEILRPFFTKFRGKEIKTIGDSFLVEFGSALEATLCATEIQKSLHEYNISAGQDHEIEVRIGIHLGDIIRKKNDVFGDAVNIASRIQPLADPEGVCISEQVYDQIHNKIELSLEELEHPKLKNVNFRTVVYKVVMPWEKARKASEEEELELAEGQISIKTPNNLPAQTPLIGRRDLIESIWPLLLRNNVRVLTLTGPGGIGKTSTSIEVAKSLLDSFPNGVYFVPLAPITDSNLVLPTIAKVIGVKEQGNKPLIETLKDFLSQKKVLLLLDNFEQIASSSAHFVSELSDSCPKLKFLITTRKPLRIHGEQEFAIPPLSVPSLKNLPSIGELYENPAIALFLERIHAIKPDFEISNGNARDIAEICVRLDGLPLALELAAARIKILPPHMILARLGNKLGLLSGGAKDLPARQQALRNTIAWSYDLLSESERKLFRRLGVFVGGFSIEAAESVCLLENEELNVLDDITGLLENSLLKRFGQGEQSEEEETSISESEYRFGFLETIHEFASECLKKCKEAEAIQKARTDFFLALAEKTEPKLNGPNAVEWLSRLELEHDNMRASLRWCIDRKESERGIRLAGSLGKFWEYHNYLREGREWLEAAIKIAPFESSIGTAKVLVKEGILAIHQGDYHNAIDLLREAHFVSLRIGDGNGVAQSLSGLAFAANRQGEYSKASGLYEESANLFRQLQNSLGTGYSLMGLSWALRNLSEEAKAKSILKESIDIFRKLGDKNDLAVSLNLLGHISIKTEDYNVSRSLLLEGLSIAEELHDDRTVGVSLMSLAELARLHGKDSEAISLLKQVIVIFQESGERSGLASSWHNLAQALIHEKQYSEATKYFGKSISLFQELKEKSGLASCVAGLAGVALAQGLSERGARLLGATEAFLRIGSASLDPIDRIEFERNLSSARGQLGPEKFSEELGVGSRFTLDQAIAYGLEK